MLCSKETDSLLPTGKQWQGPLNPNKCLQNSTTCLLSLSSVVAWRCHYKCSEASYKPRILGHDQLILKKIFMIYLKFKLRWAHTIFPGSITYSWSRPYMEAKVIATFHFYLWSGTKVYALTSVTTSKVSVQCTEPHTPTLYHLFHLCPPHFSLSL